MRYNRFTSIAAATSVGLLAAAACTPTEQDLAHDAINLAPETVQSRQIEPIRLPQEEEFEGRFAQASVEQSAVDPDEVPTGVGVENNDGSSTVDSGEAQSFDLLDQLRSGLGVGRLTRDTTMDAFARDWSRTMASTGAFEHSNGPYGENIAFTSDTRMSADDAAQLFHDLWVNSPGHYANMVETSYTEFGAGLFLNDRGWYGTQVFR